MLSYLQRVGRALMVPVATLPAAAILFGIGYWIDPTGTGADNMLAALLIKSGSAITEHMPVLLAIGVAYGLSRDKDGAAALSGFIGYLVVTSLCSAPTVAIIRHIPLNELSQAFSKIDNQFIGILTGIISATIYNRYSTVELPSALSFFSGRRLVPILVSVVMIGVALCLMYLWPILFAGLVNFGQHIQKLGATGAGLYGFFNRLLIPVGLHHALNSVFWFDVAGINDIPNFLGGERSIADGRAIVGLTGRYQAGFFPVMMFGLPGAALAIWRSAYPQHRNRVAGIMLAAAFAAFFTGITEPLEFTFMFVAPQLYFLHAVLTGLSMFIAASLHWIAGFGFSAGLIDLLLSSHNALATHWYMLLLQGLIFFVIYYVLFRFAIVRFNLQTPGREPLSTEQHAEVVVKTASAVVAQSGNDNNEQLLAEHYFQALGGRDNLMQIDACITRLRLKVVDTSQVDKSNLSLMGASGVVILNQHNVQVVVGMRAEKIAGLLKQYHSLQPLQLTPVTDTPFTEPICQAVDSQHQVIAGRHCYPILAPISGQVVALSQVEDSVFASKAAGEGIAVMPDRPEVLAPATGVLVKIFPTHHAFCLETDQGIELLVHLGLDTVQLAGEGFRLLLQEGDRVAAGQPVIQMDLAYLQQHARSLVSPIVVTNSDDCRVIIPQSLQRVEAGETVLYYVMI